MKYPYMSGIFDIINSLLSINPHDYGMPQFNCATFAFNSISSSWSDYRVRCLFNLF